MEFTDIHIHALFGVDDGAKTEADMRAITDASYADGVRTLCVTPHYHPGYFGDNHRKTSIAFQALKEYARHQYPELEICCGNELRYSTGCVSWLQSGQCRTLNGTQYTLVDFSEAAEVQTISGGLEQLLNAGYRPVLAHVERYRALWRRMRLLRSFLENGVILQLDAGSLLGSFGYRVQRQSRLLLGEGLIELVCSDSHDTRQRPPQLSQSFQYVQKKYGTNCARALFRDNGLKLLPGGAAKEELD